MPSLKRSRDQSSDRPTARANEPQMGARAVGLRLSVDAVTSHGDGQVLRSICVASLSGSTNLGWTCWRYANRRHCWRRLQPGSTEGHDLSLGVHPAGLRAEVLHQLTPRLGLHAAHGVGHGDGCPVGASVSGHSVQDDRV